MTVSSDGIPIGPARSDSGILMIADHASSFVPPPLDLGVVPELLRQHVAIDIGVDPLARWLCDRLDLPGILGSVSRLVVDLNREEDNPGLIPVVSDGHPIAGNNALSDEEKRARIDLYWRPYHDRIAQRIAETKPNLLISLHSFTPKLATSDEARPWQIGILYNRDDRAARIAIPLLETAGVVTGDNLPYSGQLLNATMNRHAEGNGIAYLGIEIRQDLVADPAGIAHWGEILAPVIKQVAERLSSAPTGVMVKTMVSSAAPGG